MPSNPGPWGPRGVTPCAGASRATRALSNPGYFTQGRSLRGDVVQAQGARRTGSQALPGPIGPQLEIASYPAPCGAPGAPANLPARVRPPDHSGGLGLDAPLPEWPPAQTPCGIWVFEKPALAPRTRAPLEKPIAGPRAVWNGRPAPKGIAPVRGHCSTTPRPHWLGTNVGTGSLPRPPRSGRSDDLPVGACFPGKGTQRHRCPQQQ